MNCARTSEDLDLVACGVTELAEGEGEVGLVLRHGIQQVLDQRLVAVAFREQADLLAQACLIGVAERL